jgi:glycine hydroxymethyltransferase
MPVARYLPGADVMDLVEEQGEQLALELLGSAGGYRATLQPHSGTQANQIVYNAVLGAEDTALCLRPYDGGHISHTVLISRRNQTINYGLTPAGLVNIGQLRTLAVKHRPRLIIVGGSSLPRAIDLAACAKIAHDTGALLHADLSHTATFVAAGLHPSALPHCDFVTFNTVKNLRGPNAGVLVYRSEHADTVAQSIFPMTQGGANESAMLAKLACLLEWSQRDIGVHARAIRRCAQTLADGLAARGIQLVTGGTDCHLLLVDLQPTGRSGADVEQQLQEAGVLANRNLVPGDPRPPAQTSGLRIGTANLAILGYRPDDLAALAGWLADVFDGLVPSAELVEELVERYQGHLVAPVW